eukprot:TRINITY_DN866_c0_g1_i3.p1 TRINITY_DN866_c0_g1~~TRINITY_DN866_c0_g1_i3.p1  ORF type:complete len:382 (+),score=66.63 TRINITY_DN866_c0_g1_i3:85-1230(+)
MSVEIKDSDTYDEAIIDGLDPQEVEIDSWLERLNSPSLEDVSITLEFLSMSEWIPWMDPQTNKNKQRFAERGGIERIGSLLGDPNMSIDIRRECIVNLRNFCETPNLFRYVFRAGIIPCLLPLLRSDLLVTDVTGLLFGILEFDSQAHICPCYGKEFVRELVLECERVNRMTKNRNSDVSFDQHRSIMGCLLALSLNDLSNSALFALGGAEALMCQNSDILTQYLSCIGTAFLLANPNNRWKKRKKKDALAKISFFMKYSTAKEIRQLENKMGLLWSNVEPFYKLTEYTRDNTVVQFGVFLLTILSHSDYYKQLFERERILGKILCLQWLESKGATFNLTSQIISNLHSFVCPTLKELCSRAILCKYPLLHSDYFKLIKNF